MTRATLLLTAAAWTLFLVGCGGGDREASEPDARGASAVDRSDEAPIDTSGAKSGMVRALLSALDEVKGEGEGARNDLRRILLDADDELSATLGDNSRRLIMQHANQKPAPLVIGGYTPAAQPAKPPVNRTAESDSADTDDEPGEPQTQIVRALLTTLDEVELDDEDESVKAELRRSLIEADVQLRQVLGENSKRRIVEHANKKPLAPRIPEGLPMVESP